MAQAHNPYAPPQSPLITNPFVGDAGLARDGKALVMHPTQTLPHRCIKCNDPAKQVNQRRLYWTKPVWFLAAIISPILLLIVVLIVRKGFSVGMPLCRKHAPRHQKARWAVGLFLCLTLGLTATAIALKSGPLAVAATGTLIPLLIAALINRLAYLVRVKDELLWVRGISPKFLDNLPQHQAG